MKAIYKRELGAYFKSLTGPVFIALFLAATGVYTRLPQPGQPHSEL